MKTITIANWVLIGVYGLLILYTVLNGNRSGNDAAGRSLEAGFVFLGVIVLVVLIVLNVLPYRFARLAVLVVGLLPLLMGLYNLISNYWVSRQYERTEAARANGSLFFEDKNRQEMAAAISRADTVRLRIVLQKPVPNLNECGKELTTLLDFAAYHTTQSRTSPASLRCLEMLMEKGATLQGSDPNHKPTHFLACRDGSAALLAWFLEKGADPNVKPPESSPILFHVMSYGEERLEKVKLLLDHGADPNTLAFNTGYAVRDGYSPLMYAAEEQLWDIGRLLLERGANPGHQTKQGESLRKIMKLHEDLYADVNDTPASYTAFKSVLETYSAKKP
ncbi:ankyrin repeat domain-containing protein [Larkinella bovis]|uniref:Ankyrin repeat domain-containing protein n=1 Tax=Larkinella bovis TaxID=683041 RepID=A0ABW0IF55_9BACT